MAINSKTTSYMYTNQKASRKFGKTNCVNMHDSSVQYALKDLVFRSGGTPGLSIGCVVFLLFTTNSKGG